MSTSPSWVSAFLDFAPGHFEPGVAFWAAVTEYDASPRRGDAGEFATLVPPEGDDYLRVQRLGDGEDRVHLDLHVADPRSAADRAVALGATEVADRDGYVVLTSPGGLTYCLVGHPAAHRPPPRTWPDGHRSLLDQVCVDAPEAAYDAECGFWAALTGWPHDPSDASPEFSHLVCPPEQPVRVLFQRLGEADGPVRAHLDYASDDRDAEIDRHRSLGASVEGHYRWWTVLTDPVGRRYCVVDRDPET